ncbi:hypothetical protein SteCoe_4561 [Stentor coeruleus]|uniref:Uncharacterized protein n=1 Tax=Stentor coeruleus TaxID=5963 RepID=A0A1R2CUN1_9CILI|nr:hypothetical protein SteCoe_4561 [Stentor coeruleus]
MNEHNDELDIISEPDEKKSEHEIYLFKDAYKDSYFFDELQTHEPLDWVNIPKPLQLVLNSMKKCLISNNKQLSEVTDKVHFLTTRYKKKLETHDDEIVLMKLDLKNMHDGMMKILADSKQSLNNDLYEYKKHIQKDLEFNKKNIDGKIAYIDDQILGIKKFVSTLPTPDELERKIKNTIDKASETLKDDLVKNYIQPEVNSLKNFANQIFDFSSNLKNEFEEFKQKSQAKIQEVEKSASVSFHMLSENIKKSTDKINEEIIKNEEHFNNKYERHAKSIEALTTSFHELNHKNFLEFKSITKEIDSLKHKSSVISEEILHIKKEIKELKELEEKVYQDSEEYQMDKSRNPSEYFTNLPHTLSNYNTHEYSNSSNPHIDSDIFHKDSYIPQIDSKNSYIPQIDSKNSHKNSHTDSHIEVNISNINTHIQDNLIIPEEQNPKDSESPTEEKSTPVNVKNSLETYQPLQSNPAYSNPSPIHLQVPNTISKQKTTAFTRLAPKKRSNPQVPDDIYATVSKLQKYVNKKIDIFEEKLNKEINETVIPLEQKLKSIINANELDFSEIKQKLAWLPMNFSQIKGKDPTEARIFTIEARLRTEENARMEAFNKCMDAINSARMVTSPTLDHDLILPPIRTLSVTQERNFSQDSGFISDLRKQTESEFGKKNNITGVFSSSMEFSARRSYFKKFSLGKTMNAGFRESTFLSKK